MIRVRSSELLRCTYALCTMHMLPPLFYCV